MTRSEALLRIGNGSSAGMSRAQWSLILDHMIAAGVFTADPEPVRSTIWVAADKIHRTGSGVLKAQVDVGEVIDILGAAGYSVRPPIMRQGTGSVNEPGQQQAGLGSFTIDMSSGRAK